MLSLYSHQESLRVKKKMKAEDEGKGGGRRASSSQRSEKSNQWIMQSTQWIAVNSSVGMWFKQKRKICM